MIRVRPEECTILFGIATSREEFFADQAREDRDFSRQFEGIWPRYDREFAGVLRELEPAMMKKGAAMRHGATLADFSAAFASFRVVTLFSHWLEGAVEFADGMKPWRSILEAVPETWNGVLDLCVCHPLDLASALRRERMCLVRYTSVSATPAYWLYFYVALFAEMPRRDFAYIPALDAVLDAFGMAEPQRDFIYEEAV
jgi:hypothetical protein